MNDKSHSNDEPKDYRVQSIVMSLPFLFIVGAVIFFVSFMLSSFPIAQQSYEPAKIQQVYFADNISDGHRALIQEFNTIHQGKIEVIPIDLPFSKFNTNQRKDLIARNLRSRSSRIDVFSVDLIWVPRFTKWSEPLAPYFSPQFLNELLPEALETCYVDRQLYAVPLYIDIGALFYREDLILALPDGENINRRVQRSISWEEILQIADQYFPDRPVYLLQAEAYEGLICNFNEILGKSLLDAKSGNLINLTDPLVIDRVNFMRGLIADGRTPAEVLHMTEDDCIHYALENDIPFIRGWPTVNNQGGDRFNPEKFEKLRIAPLPHFEGESPSPVFGGWNMMLSKHSPVKEAAVEFMKFAGSFHGQTTLLHSEGTLPVRQEFFSVDSISPEHQKLRQIYTMMGNGIHRPAVDDYTLISDILSLRLHQILSAETSAEKGMRMAWEEIEEIQSRGQKY